MLDGIHDVESLVAFYLFPVSANVPAAAFMVLLVAWCIFFSGPAHTLTLFL